MPVSIPLAENTEPTASTPRNIRTTTLPNGLRIFTEQMPHLRSVSMGAWIDAGSRDESAETNGLAHFVEHMVFKGTTSRSAQDIAREVDAIGGNLDAFTGKETTCFSIKALDAHVAPALDVLADLVLNPKFTADDLAREQGVILEEIKMDEDNPDYLVHETFMKNFWPGAPLGRSILGTAKNVQSFTRETVEQYHAERFTAGTLCFSAAGNLDHDEFVGRVENYFSALPSGPSVAALRTAPETQRHITLKRKKSLEQVQVCLGVPALAVSDPRRYALYLMNSMLGGGMSSRLFQSVREERGLAYSIYSELSPFRDCGSFCIYAGTSVEKTEELLKLTVAELCRLKNEPVAEAELTRAKEQLKSNIILGLESAGSRMSNLARQQMYYGRFFGTAEVTREIESVTPDDIFALANDLFRPEALALTLLGNLGEMEIAPEQLAC
jgi:predicted Zn-dependent peptidase